MAMVCIAEIGTAQVVVPVGSGSYASSIPAADQFAGGFYSMTSQQTVNQYTNLHLDPSLTNRPIPSSKWWTDVLIGDRSYQPGGGGPRVLQQDSYGGQLWSYPVMLAPNSTGFNLYFPNSWNIAASTNTPDGGFNAGTALQITATEPVQVGVNDILIVNFEGTNYPAGWTNTGTAFGSGPIPGGGWPGQSPAVTGFIGNACVNTYRGSDTPQGTLTSSNFIISKKYIDLLVGGGNDTNLTVVQLVVGTNVVKNAIGRQSGTLYWNSWDVTAYLGQTATIKIVDQSSGSWGFIMCDFIVQTDNGGDPALRYTSSFAPVRSVVTDWSDWGFQFGLPDAIGNRMDITLARGVPFVWTTYSGVQPAINFGNVALYDTNGSGISTATGYFTNSAFAFDYQGRSFGVFAPSNTIFTVSGNSIQVGTNVSSNTNYLIYALLPAHTNLLEFSQYAYAKVTGTQMDWSYDAVAGRVNTTWTLATTPLKPGQTNTLQGWLPHHYRTTHNTLAYKPYTYLTPRGVMRVTAGNKFTFSYDFQGIAPMLPAPRISGLTNDYVASRLSNYVANFASGGHPQSYGETYGQGKELGVTAQYMTFAHQLGMTNQESQLATSLRSMLVDWYTYTPGETEHFFGKYTNWPALIGFSASYGTEAFNDNHFHYGYYMVASALMGLEDSSFLSQYGGMTRLIAKEYANWDRTETNFPFMRTLDIWEGHSWAGGFSSGGGENQESSSEAMNSWAGLFLLGNSLGDTNITAAGAMGYCMESSAVNEYWQDMYHSNFSTGYGKGMVGILQSGSDAYATYFSGDPAWIYGIQMVPANHWNNYLSRNPAFAAQQLSNMYSERVIASSTGLNGFTLSDANNAVALGGYLGNYVLGFQMLFDSDGVASIMDSAYNTNGSVATDGVFSGITYYLTYSLRNLGLPDTNYHTSLPLSQVYYNSRTGNRTAVLYNNSTNSQTVTLYNQSGVVGTFLVPPGASVVNPSAQTNQIAASIQIGKKISWLTSGANTYQPQWSDNGSTWTALGGVIAGTGSTNTLFDAAQHSHYRILEYTLGTSLNPVSNPGYETGSTTNDATDWKFTSNKSGVNPVRSANSHSGSYALKVYSQTDTNDSGHNVAAYQKSVSNTLQNITIVPGKSYNFSMWLRDVPNLELPSGYSTVGVVSFVDLYWTDGSGNNIGANLNTHGTFGPGSQSAWTQFQFSNLVAPANAIGVFFQCTAVTGAVAKTGGGLYVDDLSLTYGAPGVTNNLAPLTQSAVQLGWQTVAGQNYQAQFTSTLASTNTPWSSLGSASVGNGTASAIVDILSTNQTRFYKVLATP